MSNKKAFLLFEVTLTVAILSLGLVLVIRSINMCMGAAKTSSNYSQAVNLASEKTFALDLASSMSNLSLDLEEEGNFLGNENFYWQYFIEDLEGYNLGEVVLKIGWKEGKRQGEFAITTYVATSTK